MKGETILSVGIDIGTTTTQLIFSRLTVRDEGAAFSVPKFAISEKEVLYRSRIHFTPLLSDTVIDAEGVRRIIDAEYAASGFRKEDIDLDVKDGVLTISAQHQESNDQHNGNYVCKERRYGSFARSFNLEGIQEENITAAYNNGVLSLTLPKFKPAEPETHRIAIQ